MADATNPIVILVDHRNRDLPGAALLAYHLQRRGTPCKLVPLEAYQAALSAYRPSLILFNHLMASHLAAFSKRLHKMGVLVGVLLNEGLIYNRAALAFNTNRNHPDVHVDIYFSWNEIHAQELRKREFAKNCQVEVIGIPRFDFYFSPWREVLKNPNLPPKTPGVTRVLAVSSAGLADKLNWDPALVDEVFSMWVKHVDYYKDYWGAIRAHHAARESMFEHIQALLKQERFEVVVRPHPREELDRYSNWLSSLSAQERSRVILDHDTPIGELIMDCDVELSLHRCTTAIECWLLGRPDIELPMEKHPILYSEERDYLAPECHQPEELAGLVDAAVADPMQTAFAEKRQQHLQAWCAAPNGKVTQKMAELLLALIQQRQAHGPDTTQLHFEDWRKGWKLRLMDWLDKPYHWHPGTLIKRGLGLPVKEMRIQQQEKAVRPSEARAFIEKIARLAAAD
ncbi:hypothetical protein Mmc1_2417 [Magnetococcus marinus MC-1]|uniref:Surface carbohydrate biosynthesis protein n=1 Tax=Magnetococcus marinus (strain ATCC BAA-1437 / JCM 17883 / MC-1) TaxID=156889 RepID=A0LAC4_MAGMM|nr:surface carbohydrate biosynthesis protein [Magnetococcus marinus]ABK44917.1 hypothetical protein Mmc1_2417 [Magnetococcus marinus MC-1]